MRTSYSLRRGFPLAAVVAAVAVLLVWHVARAQSNRLTDDADRASLHGNGQTESLDRNGQSESEIGLAISPVPIDLHGQDRALVGLGSYIVNAQGACNTCHAGARSDNLGLYLAGSPSGGPNLTPDDSGLPNGLSLQQFFNIMRNGVNPEGDPISPAMPWEVFRNMTDPDLLAIYAFLLTIPTQPGPR